MPKKTAKKAILICALFALVTGKGFAQDAFSPIKFIDTTRTNYQPQG